MISGTLELLALRALHAAGPLHGYAVLDLIRRSTGNRLIVEEGALYPALHRMERRGWLDAEWGTSEHGRKAKYYRLTKQGAAALVAEGEKWEAYVDAMARMAPNATSG